MAAAPWDARVSIRTGIVLPFLRDSLPQHPRHTPLPRRRGPGLSRRREHALRARLGTSDRPLRSQARDAPRPRGQLGELLRLLARGLLRRLPGGLYSGWARGLSDVRRRPQRDGRRRDVSGEEVSRLRPRPGRWQRGLGLRPDDRRPCLDRRGRGRRRVQDALYRDLRPNGGGDGSPRVRPSGVVAGPQSGRAAYQLDVGATDGPLRRDLRDPARIRGPPVLYLYPGLAGAPSLRQEL